MENEKFEQIVQAQKDLNLLINEKKFGILCKIKKTDEMTPEFIDWLSPKYFDSLQHIYNKHHIQNPQIVGAVIRMSFLANEETKLKVKDLIQFELDKSLKAASKLVQLAEIRKFSLEDGKKCLEDMFSLITLSVMRNVDEPFVHEFKKDFVNRSLAAADKMKGLKASRDMEQFIIYENLLDKLEKNNILEGKSEKFEAHVKNKNSKNTVAIVIAVLLALFAILRLANTLSR
ncbi:hypothetical protein K6119_10240 [Paracrocinitomix mangrovi]|uniref:hypothetical protein n=1 Tax=Paracrocinitomix mangrovi TaxID=2862509 RepID=UPI001C8D1083|nr:hypothetical protein [Paracrocinitomix mangrovi]UKN00112.1 hypothetical protein K6119_10240 [Paracrocinitomix mangrovi]